MFRPKDSSYITQFINNTVDYQFLCNKSFNFSACLLTLTVKLETFDVYNMRIDYYTFKDAYMLEAENIYDCMLNCI